MIRNEVTSSPWILRFERHKTDLADRPTVQRGYSGPHVTGKAWGFFLKFLSFVKSVAGQDMASATPVDSAL